MATSVPSPSQGWPAAGSWRLVIGLAVAYYAAAQLGLRFATVNGLISPMWFPAGVAFAALLSGGLRLWPVVFLADAVVQAKSGVPWPAGLASAAAAAAGAWLGANLTLQVAPRFPQAEWSKDFFSFLLLAAAPAALVSGGLGVSALLALDALPVRQWFDALATRVMGDWIGIGIVVPMVMTWIGRPRPMTFDRWREATVIIVALAALSVLSFGVVYSSPTEGLSVRWALYPFIAWASVRFGLFGASGSVFLVSVVATWATARDRGPFGTDDPIPASWRLGGYLMVTVASAYSIAFLLAARERGHTLVAQRLRRVEGTLRTTSAAILQLDEAGLVLDLNPAMERLMGWPRDAVVGHPVDLLVALPSRDALREAMRSVASEPATLGGRSRVSVQIVGARHDGSVVPLRADLENFTDARERFRTLTLQRDGRD